MSKIKYIYIIAVFILLSPAPSPAELLRTGQRTCYDQEGNIVGHVGTGQDGDLQAGRVWPDPRFKDNGDGTITDLSTGLMWVRDGSCLGWLSWQAAMTAAQDLNSMAKVEEHCGNLNISYDDWRLPTIQELESLINSESKEPYGFLNFYGFRAIQPDSYWSSTTGPNPYGAWLLHLDSGEVMSGGKVEAHHVLLVRKGKEIVEISKSLKKSNETPAGIDTSIRRNHLLEHLSLLRNKISFFDKEDSVVSQADHLPNNSIVAPVRFIDNGDGTVTDIETDLMWMKDVSCLGSVNWQAGLETLKAFNSDSVSFNCQESAVTVYDDWSMPNRNELRSLISYSTDLPALATDFPADEIKPYYWTSTSMASHPEMAYGVYMGTGELTVSPKREEKYIWPVRPAPGRPERQRIPDKTQTVELRAEHFLLRPIGNRIDIEWPVKRFSDYGDGTLIDNITGLMWLKDARCLGKQNWQQSAGMIRRLNRFPRRLECEEYTAAYDNWQFPDENDFANLLESAQGEPAEWLNTQGANRVQPRDYWTLTDNPYNLYHAWAINMLEGGGRNYPKSFELFVWPYRKQLIVGPVNPVVSVKVNGEAGNLVLARSQELILSVSVDYNKGAVVSEYRISYEAPDGTVWWLTANGQWFQDERMVYYGNMFHLDEYTVFHAGTSNLEPGEYTFHFSVTPVLEKESPPIVFSSDFVLTLEETASTEDVIDEEVTILLD